MLNIKKIGDQEFYRINFNFQGSKNELGSRCLELTAILKSLQWSKSFFIAWAVKLFCGYEIEEDKTTVSEKLR